ncbi:hypothetical protein GDO81_024054 [Engystomops pustulosus]|uniref:Uncharacterized protein n=1 Tax=Engystomops pustulosus TaxID=76066 RepID=A0AAV6YJM2_ENGPU|nr:hypothetical protein GDO81_024054 [Engystomops pustulosus]
MDQDWKIHVHIYHKIRSLLKLIPNGCLLSKIKIQKVSLFLLSVCGKWGQQEDVKILFPRTSRTSRGNRWAIKSAGLRV